ncbi:MAG TPA: peroxidase-related enzyme [Aliidongia sp.]|nr:peroxidase-related enzyme [Aliidongia sp.]
MPLINTPSIETAPAASQPYLQAVKSQLGVVPNMFRLFANSPAVLEGFLGLHGALGKGKLSNKTRERLALAVAQLNGCDYCLSAHTYFSMNFAKLDDAEIARNRKGVSADEKADVALHFALDLTRERGRVGESDVQKLLDAGYGADEILEIIAHVVVNLFANYVNIALGTEIDFPLVRA